MSWKPRAREGKPLESHLKLDEMATLLAAEDECESCGHLAIFHRPAALPAGREGIHESYCAGYACLIADCNCRREI